MSSQLLKLKQERAKSLETELEAVKRLLDISPPDKAQAHYERAESLLKDLEEVNRDIKILEGERSLVDPDGRTAAVTADYIPDIVQASARSQQVGEEGAAEKRETQYRGAFYNYLRGQDDVQERALLTLSTSGAVVPTTTWNQILENIQKQEGLLARVRVLQVPGKLSIPVADLQSAATWHTEGQEISESNVPPTSVALAGYELAKLFSMSAATQKMTASIFEQYLVAELTRCTRDALSKALFAGSGNGQPLGIKNLTWNAANSVTASSWTEIAKAMGLMPANFRQGSVFVMNSSTFFQSIAGMSTSEGYPIMANNVSTGMPMKLLGKEILIDDFCPDNVIYFQNPSYYFLNFSQPIRVERSSEAGFDRGVVLYRSMVVVDGRPAVPSAFVKITVGE